MDIIETDFRQREYDGKWEMLGKVLDMDSSYSYKSETGSRVTLIPEKWITIGVYDYLIELED